jgi:nitroimidazol reductase NimA-like FMN-containing flavoprotein (pyridoxamine 5'-phosphate oxidase superfamily)
MHETTDDIAWLQSVLDRSYDAAGEHLRSITTPVRRIPAEELSAILGGVQIIDVATVTAAGTPRVGPVDGLFYRGRLYFGSSRTSLRYRNLLTRPQVSAAHTRGEELGVVVHGTARLFALTDPGAAEFRAYCHEVYVPRYGEAWAEFGDRPDIFYACIEPEKMFTFRMDTPRLPE